MYMVRWSNMEGNICPSLKAIFEINDIHAADWSCQAPYYLGWGRGLSEETSCKLIIVACLGYCSSKRSDDDPKRRCFVHNIPQRFIQLGKLLQTFACFIAVMELDPVMMKNFETTMFPPSKNTFAAYSKDWSIVTTRVVLPHTLFKAPGHRGKSRKYICSNKLELLSMALTPTGALTDKSRWQKCKLPYIWIRQTIVVSICSVSLHTHPKWMNLKIDNDVLRYYVKKNSYLKLMKMNFNNWVVTENYSKQFFWLLLSQDSYSLFVAGKVSKI